jgi:hypothetical protein
MFNQRVHSIKSHIKAIANGNVTNAVLTRRFVHRLAPKPSLMHKIPTLDLDGEQKFLKRTRKGTMQELPRFKGKMFARWGGDDLSRWPRESDEKREITKKEIEEATELDQLYYTLYKRKNTIHFEEIYACITKIINIAIETNQVAKMERDPKFWTCITQADRWFWGFSARLQVQFLNSLAKADIRSTRTFNIGQYTLKEMYDGGYLRPNEFALAVHAYAKTGMHERCKMLFHYLDSICASGAPLKFRKDQQWNASYLSMASHAVANLKGKKGHFKALMQYLSDEILNNKKRWDNADMYTISQAANAFSNVQEVRSRELMVFFRDLATPLLNNANVKDLCMVSGSMTFSLNGSSKEFDAAFSERCQELLSDGETKLKDEELHVLTRYVSVKDIQDDKLKNVLVETAMTSIESNYNIHSLIRLTNSHALMGTKNADFYKLVMKTSVSYMPGFTPLELGQFATALTIAKAPSKKIYSKIGSTMSKQIREYLLGNRMFPFDALAQTLGIFASGHHENDRLYLVASRAIELVIHANEKQSYYKKYKEEDLVQILGAYVAAGKGVEYSELMVDILKDLSSSTSGKVTSMLYQAYMILQKDGVIVDEKWIPKKVRLQQSEISSSEPILDTLATALKANGEAPAVGGIIKVDNTHSVDIALPGDKKVAIIVAKKYTSSLKHALKCMHLRKAGWKVVEVSAVDWNADPDVEGFMKKVRTAV